MLTGQKVEAQADNLVANCKSMLFRLRLRRVTVHLVETCTWVVEIVFFLGAYQVEPMARLRANHLCMKQRNVPMIFWKTSIQGSKTKA
jgi:hypothetical protein